MNDLNPVLKSALLPVVLLLICSYSFAQTEFIATYEYSSYGGYKNSYDLIVNNGASLFVFHKDYTRSTDNDNTKYFHFPSHYEFCYKWNGSITEKAIQKDGTPLIAEWQADLEWVIKDEYKTINGYKVRKAVTPAYLKAPGETWDYGDAIAWFTEEIPVSAGPDRYYGLPGLIVRLEHSRRKNVFFTLTSITFDKVPEISKPEGGIRVSKDQIIRQNKINKAWLKRERKKHRFNYKKLAGVFK